MYIYIYERERQLEKLDPRAAVPADPKPEAVAAILFVQLPWLPRLQEREREREILFWAFMRM